MEKILIIEDEEPISELIRLNLSLVGFETSQAFDGAEGLGCIRKGGIDLVILDIMLPEIDGYQLLPTILEKKIPVIILTAKDSLRDKVKGLNLGADDYITKPFEGIELLARVRALLRRAGKEAGTKGFEDIQLFFEQRRVFKSGEEIELTPKEFDLLRTLLENKGIALSRERLLQMVWGYDFEGNTRTVDMHIQRLRNKLKTDRIKTVYKIGYRLEA